MILGITGGLGCGKSFASNMFMEAGFRHLDSDAIVRLRVLTRPEVTGAVRNRFGAGVMTRDGEIDRALLGPLVFSDDAAREWLEALTHPLVFEEWEREIAASPGSNWAVEVPLLFEKGLENRFDFIICVACAPAKQLARLEQRGLSRALAEQRISKQLPLARKIELSDFVLLNDGSPEFLREQVDLVVRSLPVSRA